MTLTAEPVGVASWRAVAEARASEIGSGVIGIYRDRFVRPDKLLWEARVVNGQIADEKRHGAMKGERVWLVAAKASTESAGGAHVEG